MKFVYLFATLGFLAVFPFMAVSQVSRAYMPDNEKYDTITSDEIKLTGYHIGISKNNLLPVLKWADSSSQYEGEGDCRYTYFYFKKSIITICGDEFSEFEINDRSLPVSIKNKRIYTGMKDGILKVMFPKSYSIRDKVEPNKTFVRIYIDEYHWLLFVLNDQNLIKEINYFEDNTYNITKYQVLQNT